MEDGGPAEDRGPRDRPGENEIGEVGRSRESNWDIKLDISEGPPSTSWRRESHHR